MAASRRHTHDQLRRLRVRPRTSTCPCRTVSSRSCSAATLHDADIVIDAERIPSGIAAAPVKWGLFPGPFVTVIGRRASPPALPVRVVAGGSER